MVNQAVVQSPIWRDAHALRALVDLLFLTGPAGEYSTSRRFLAQRWGWSTSKVNRFLTYLASPVSPHRIALRTTGAGESARTLISFVLESARSRPGDSLSDTPPDHSPDRPPNHLSRANARDTRTREPSRHPPSGSNRNRPRIDEAGRRPRCAERADERTAELLPFAERLIGALNWGQQQNAHVDRTAFRLVQVDQHASLATVHELRQIGVDPEFAEQYVRSGACSFRPTERHSQISSLAYFRGGLLAAWAKRRQLELPPPIARARVLGPRPGPATAPPSAPVISDRPRRSGAPVRVDGPLGELLERLQKVGTA